MKKLGLLVTCYGIFLMICGLSGYLLMQGTGTSSLLNGGIFGSLMIVIGLLLRQGRMWTLPATLSATAIFALTFLWRGVVQWHHALSDAPARLGVALLLTLMFLGSVIMVRILFRHYRH